jgi:DNA-directed RNA polymerase specialized sigma24 family protein
MILSCAAAGADPNVDDSLAELCRTYWRPIFAYICATGRSTADAQDLTQDFFLMVLGGNFLKHADPDRGRFRSLLFKSLQNFLIKEHDKQRRKKRGGDVAFISWDDWMAEAPSRLCVPLRTIETWPAESYSTIGGQLRSQSRRCGGWVKNARRPDGGECLKR